MSAQHEVILASLIDAETKAWEALSGYKFWMFGYHAARWVNYNSLLPRSERFGSPFRDLTKYAHFRVERSQRRLQLVDVDAEELPLLASEGDGA